MASSSRVLAKVVAVTILLVAAAGPTNAMDLDPGLDCNPCTDAEKLNAVARTMARILNFGRNFNPEAEVL